MSVSMENETKILKVKTVERIIESKETEGLIECIKTLELKAFSIGEGGNAVVYATLGTAFDKVCLKKIREKPQIKFNDIHQEHEYQVMAREAGVRTPLSLISLETEDGVYLIMEKIDGFNVEEIIKNPNLLPENFDYKTFCNSLDDQVSKMHKAGLYHRDLHNRNIMIDKKGLPVIIDFGVSAQGTGSESTYEDIISKFNDKTGHYESIEQHFKDDLENVKNIKSSLKKFMKEPSLTY